MTRSTVSGDLHLVCSGDVSADYRISGSSPIFIRLTYSFEILDGLPGLPTQARAEQSFAGL